MKMLFWHGKVKVLGIVFPSAAMPAPGTVLNSVTSVSESAPAALPKLVICTFN